MCGVCGVVGGDPQRERYRVGTMLDIMAARGPDGRGIHQGDGAVLGNVRLAVIDPAGGEQPLATPDGALWITFNGEIYNHRALRDELERRGHRFRTRTDTEVVLTLFRERGPDCLPMLRGMFAFAVWEPAERTLFAARDPLGQKPFHYARVGDHFLFASEIKGLLSHPAIGAEADLEAVAHFLAHRFVPPPWTMFQGIRKLAPGDWLRWREGELTTGRYWRPRFEGDADRAARGRRSDRDWIAELGHQVDEAVRRHLVSDVPVGALLSGGLDSGAVVASYADQSDAPVRTFCVGSDPGADPGGAGARLDERVWARQVAERYGTLHRESVATADVLDTLPRLVRILDEPSDPIAACTFEAARLAAGHVKVVLGGDGGDELFAGFDRYAAFPWAERYSALPAWLRDGAVGPLVRRLPGALRYKSVGQKARWLDGLGGTRGGTLYARMSGSFRFGPGERDDVWGPELSGTSSADPEAFLARTFDEAPAPDALHRMLYTDLVTRLPEHSLLLGDRLTMAHGLELRSPFLDLDLLDFCAGMPGHLKIRRGRTKVALREAFRHRLPADVVERPKQGFMLPVASWLHEGPVLGNVYQALVSGPLVEAGWIRPRGVERLATEHGARREDHHVRLWMLLSLDAWFRTYLNGETEWPEDPIPVPAGSTASSTA